MKLGKMLWIVLVLGFLVIPQLSYAGTFAVNLRGDAAGTVEGQTAAGKAVADAAAAEQPRTPPAAPGEGGKLSSNMTLNPETIAAIRADLNTKVTLNGNSVTDIPFVTNSVGYVIGLASVGLVSRDITKNGNTYDFKDSTISPLVFSEKVTTPGDIQRQFIETVGTINPADQIAVIVAINMSPEDIKKAIQDKVDLGKVVIVQAIEKDSREAFNTLFSYKEGFSLRDLDRGFAPTVVKALQGAV